MQTSYVFGEHRVPSFTLLDIAKKKSKSSAVQYNLHLSFSEKKKTNKKTKKTPQDKNVLADLQHSFLKKKAPCYCFFVSSCILDDELQGLFVCGNVLGPQDGQKYSLIQ